MSRGLKNPLHLPTSFISVLVPCVTLGETQKLINRPIDEKLVPVGLDGEIVSRSTGTE